MSFQSLSRPSSYGQSSGNSLSPSRRSTATATSGGHDPAFRQRANALSIQVLKINSNVSAIEKLVSLSRDPKNKQEIAWAERMHDLNEVTRALAHDAAVALKALAEEVAEPGDQQPGRQLAANKLQRDFEAALVRFQSAQRASAERNRDELKHAQAAHDASAQDAHRRLASPNEVYVIPLAVHVS